MKIEIIITNDVFCYCGALANKTIDGAPFCRKHSKPKAVKIPRGRFSGLSLSKNAFNNYE